MGSLVTDLFNSLDPAHKERALRAAEVLDRFELERLAEKQRAAEFDAAAKAYGRVCDTKVFWQASDIQSLDVVPHEAEALVLVHAVWKLLKIQKHLTAHHWEGVFQELESVMAALDEVLEEERRGE